MNKRTEWTLETNTQLKLAEGCPSNLHTRDFFWIFRYGSVSVWLVLFVICCVRTETHYSNNDWFIIMNDFYEYSPIIQFGVNCTQLVFNKVQLFSDSSKKKCEGERRTHWVQRPKKTTTFKRSVVPRVSTSTPVSSATFRKICRNEHITFPDICQRYGLPLCRRKHNTSTTFSVFRPTENCAGAGSRTSSPTGWRVHAENQNRSGTKELVPDGNWVKAVFSKWTVMTT